MTSPKQRKLEKSRSRVGRDRVGMLFSLPGTVEISEEIDEMHILRAGLDLQKTSAGNSIYL